MLAAVLRLDRKIGAAICRRAARGPLATASSAIGLSADEMVWFPLPIFLTLLGLLGLSEGCEFFGDVCMVAVCHASLEPTVCWWWSCSWLW